MSGSTTLRNFTATELIFDETETKIILRFIFKSKLALVDELTINDKIRSFAQGLLLEAVDGSYALGFVQSLFGSVMHPGDGAKKVLLKFGKKAAKHWFKHAKAEDLSNIKIYETVRKNIEWSFGRVLLLYVNGLAKHNKVSHTAIALAAPGQSKTVWG
ncbi:hypothetical protein [Rheinheimera fenheensis]|uniref:hypothetical protein n=1 Tax=Rheinheimera fenheensis TaxID=3152295 RepID=UPI003260CAEC